MHIPDGVLGAGTCAAGYGTAAVMTAVSLGAISRRRDPREGIPRASIFTAAFFVASWIHVPLPPVSVHLVLNGLLGAMLGAYAFPAILIGLFFQAVMFQHGGLTTLGVNATAMGVPALLAGALFRLRRRLGPSSRAWTAVLGFASGAGGLGLAAAITFSVLVWAVPPDLDASLRRTGVVALTLSHVPLMLVEGALTAMVAVFLMRVRPQLLDGDE